MRKGKQVAHSEWKLLCATNNLLKLYRRTFEDVGDHALGTDRGPRADDLNSTPTAHAGPFMASTPMDCGSRSAWVRQGAQACST